MSLARHWRDRDKVRQARVDHTARHIAALDAAADAHA